MAQTHGRITIDKGNVTIDGGSEVVATVMQELKFGYHPCVAIRCGLVVEWLEVDERDLIAKVWVTVRELLEAAKII